MTFSVQERLAREKADLEQLERDRTTSGYGKSGAITMSEDSLSQPLGGPQFHTRFLQRKSCAHN